MEEPKPERKRGFQRDPGDALIGPSDQVDMGLKGCEESGVKRAKKRQAFLRRGKEKKKRRRYPPHSMGECRIISRKHRKTHRRELGQSDWGAGCAQIHGDHLTQWE